MSAEIVVPAALRAMPRWWHAGTEWLDTLPALAAEQCRRWGLRVDGAVMHGSNALVIPVARGGERLVLRLAPSAAEVAQQVAALRFWAGRGTVRVLDADPARGAMLLERLDGPSLREVPVREAMVELGRVMRRLAVPVPPDVPSTGSRVRDVVAEWRRQGEPFDAGWLRAAHRAAPSLRRPAADLAVDADLHSEQVLRGREGEWLAVDPVLLRGDIEYDLARVLWTRLDEMGDADVAGHFFAVVDAAGLDERRAWGWVLYRSVDYWLWGLDQGLTEDPQRCQRLVSIMQHMPLR
ncbi:aminoglycoside phosphotransferase family protein [Dactylosporangium vinaceum]|uniref:Aminoglycoside phosphotransferase family protein n=1 Tax=Dactylosporangium vinaceum TaxID=53362 RepID=A0ABV5M608_9ACTN|nr:aminoglycoside phosphotransferase family protein [Dactylosporangium vinaceum]